MITFQKILPEQIPTLPSAAVKYLENAINRTPASTSRLDVTLDIATKGYGNVYLVFDGDNLIGAVYILVYSSDTKKVVAPVLVGGDNLDSWQFDLFMFLNDFARLSNAKKVKWIGRKGWKKKYPKSRVIGYVYEHDVWEG